MTEKDKKPGGASALPPKGVEVTLTGDPIDVAAFRAKRPLEGGLYGGYAAFEGVIRRYNDGKVVTGIHYECYEVLAKKELFRILMAALLRHKAGYIEVVHRTGDLKVGDVAVFVQVMSPHRKEAFAVLDEVMDELKKTVPIWKKEFYEDASYAWPRCSHEHNHSSPSSKEKVFESSAPKAPF